ncbi:MAG: hypothetical protein QOI43_1108 [Gaiellales bacterium]|jgi:hypothetical protein|nr:hypothetical protein [Gaiellales bacterium]
MVSWSFVAADSEASVLRVAAKLGLDDPTPVRRLLGAWWAWAGALTARGELADSDVFLAQRDAEGLLELPLDVATRAIELELADLHGIGAARRAARAAGVSPKREPRDPGAPSPAERPSRSASARTPPLARPPGPARAAPPPTALIGVVAFGTLFLLVAGGIGLAQLVRHVPLPGGGDTASTAPYRAWIGILAGCGGALAALAAMRLRPPTAEALRLPVVGLAALGLFSLGLLAGAVWLEWAAGVLFGIVGAGAWLRTHLSSRA